MTPLGRQRLLERAAAFVFIVSLTVIFVHVLVDLLAAMP